MGTFKRKELFKIVRLIELDGKLEEIYSTEKNQPILEALEKSGVAVDVGFKIKFVPPKCPVCGEKIYRATILDEDDRLVRVRLFCEYCLWTEELPKE